MRPILSTFFIARCNPHPSRGLQHLTYGGIIKHFVHLLICFYSCDNLNIGYLFQLCSIFFARPHLGRAIFLHFSLMDLLQRSRKIATTVLLSGCAAHGQSLARLIPSAIAAAALTLAIDPTETELPTTDAIALPKLAAAVIRISIFLTSYFDFII